LEQILSQLVERLKEAFSDRLVSAVLYGSAVSGDWKEHSSDLNVLCVLDRLSPEEIAKSEPVFRWWRERGYPPPLLLTLEEVNTSTDCFPMEFHDMQERRRILYGADVIAGVTVDNSFYRAQVEHELRTKQILLRQKAAELVRNPDRLMKLLTDSISTFCVLGRHALILSGNPPQWRKRDIVEGLENAMGKPLPASNEILSIRAAEKKGSAAAAPSLFSGYLAETEALVRFVDGLQR
jgi:predicted nucleotidyltransferase